MTTVRDAPPISLMAMAILAALLAFGSRFAGKILTTALGWAATLLFGRVPADRQILLLGITFGSVIWLVLLAGVVIPDVGAFLLLLLPAQDLIPEEVVRLVMLAGAVIVPGIVGVLTLALRQDGRRDVRSIGEAVARGYPLTLLLSVLLLFLAGLAVWRKATSIARGRTETHVPIVVNGDAYDQVAADLDAAVTAAGLEVQARDAPASMSAPARWLAAVAGKGSGDLVPERLVQLSGPDLDILIYPMDLLVAGKPAQVSRARAAMAKELTTTAAHLTTSAEAQAIEDRLAAMTRPPGRDPQARARFDDQAAANLAAIDESMARIDIPYEEWEVLYRQRLQIERDLRAASMSDTTTDGGATAAPDQPGVLDALSKVGGWIRTGAEAALEAAADDETGKALDRMAGREWRWAARAASIAADAARDVIREEPPADDLATGEPIGAVPTDLRRAADAHDDSSGGGA